MTYSSPIPIFGDGPYITPLLRFPIATFFLITYIMLPLIIAVQWRTQRVINKEPSREWKLRDTATLMLFIVTIGRACAVLVDPYAGINAGQVQLYPVESSPSHASFAFVVNSLTSNLFLCCMLLINLFWMELANKPAKLQYHLVDNRILYYILFIASFGFMLLFSVDTRVAYLQSSETYPLYAHHIFLMLFTMSQLIFTLSASTRIMRTMSESMQGVHSNVSHDPTHFLLSRYRINCTFGYIFMMIGWLIELVTPISSRSLDFLGDTFIQSGITVCIFTHLFYQPNQANRTRVNQAHSAALFEQQYFLRQRQQETTNKPINPKQVTPDISMIEVCNVPVTGIRHDGTSASASASPSASGSPTSSVRGLVLLDVPTAEPCDAYPSTSCGTINPQTPTPTPTPTCSHSTYDVEMTPMSSNHARFLMVPGPATATGTATETGAGTSSSGTPRTSQQQLSSQQQVDGGY